MENMGQNNQNNVQNNNQKPGVIDNIKNTIAGPMIWMIAGGAITFFLLYKFIPKRTT